MAQPTRHIFSYINQNMVRNWNLRAFSDYGTNTVYTYGEVAEQIARLHVLYQQMGILPGDKVAICGYNSSHWAIGFLSVIAYGAVAVSILPDFTSEDIGKLVNHSDAQVLLVGPQIAKRLYPNNMPNIKAMIGLQDFSLLYANNPKLEEVFANKETLFSNQYPSGFTRRDVHYREDNLDDLAIINYTSGTSSTPKGVMLSHRALGSNLTFCFDHMTVPPGTNYVSILPLAHMFGMMIELIFNFASGAYIHFITKISTPVLMKAYKEYKPMLILSVPMVLEKIYTKKIKPELERPIIKLLWKIPAANRLLKRKMKKKLMDNFGGNLDRMIAGGAAISEEVEQFFLEINFPFLVGYGMTETAPLIGYSHWYDYVPRSCGQLVDRLEIRIDSPDSANIPGEILLKGDPVMMGYYKNEEATKAAFTEDGWMRTGDIGVVDANKVIYLRGRCKNMILGASGQNIYPEEIEGLLNLETMIEESLVVNRDGKLIALIYAGHIKSRSKRKRLKLALEQSIVHVNSKLPAYSRLAGFELREKEFEKTPKQSIKRFLYN